MLAGNIRVICWKNRGITKVRYSVTNQYPDVRKRKAQTFLYFKDGELIRREDHYGVKVDEMFESWLESKMAS